MDNEKFLEEMKRALELAKKLSSATDISHRNKPYYAPKYAEVVKETIDRILQTAEVLIFPFNGMSPNTIKMQWYQGKDYLVTVMDPSYAEKAAKVEASLDRKRGLIVALKPDRVLKNPVVYQEWRYDLLKFIEAAEIGDVKRWQGLAITDDDIQFLYDQLTPLSDMFAFDYDKKQGTIRVVRI